MNILEITNEFLVLLSTYFLFLYSDGFILIDDEKLIDIKVKDWQAQETLGWFHVSHLAVLVILNMSFMLGAQIGDLYRRIKLFYLKR